MELWLKRYLGLFFDFEYFGNLIWLAIPLFIYFLITIKKRKRWEMALTFVFIISFLALELRGGYWYRYILTIYPFILGVILIKGWEFIREKNRYFKISVFVLCGILVLFNYYHYRGTYKRFVRHKLIVKNYYYFPYELLEFINNVKDLDSDSKFLIHSHRNLFYYYSNKNGINYRSPELRFFYNQKNQEAALNVLKNRLKIKYILIYWNLNTPWIELLQKIIANYCDLVYQFRNELYLYKLREKELEQKELKELFVNDSLLRNGSFENWSLGALKNPDLFEDESNLPEGNVIREEKEVKVGKYSLKITGDNFNFSQSVINFEDYKGKKITFCVWVNANVPNKYRIQISDGINSSVSKRHWGGGNWELLEINHSVNPRAKFLKASVIQSAKTGKIDDAVYVDGALLVEGDWNSFYSYALHMKKKNSSDNN